MIAKDKKILYSKVIAKFGKKRQTNLLIEKCQSLALTLQRANNDYRVPMSKIYEDIVKVKIMIEQYEFVFGKKGLKEYENPQLNKWERLVR